MVPLLPPFCRELSLGRWQEGGEPVSRQQRREGRWAPHLQKPLGLGDSDVRVDSSAGLWWGWILLTEGRLEVGCRTLLVGLSILVGAEARQQHGEHCGLRVPLSLRALPHALGRLVHLVLCPRCILDGLPGSSHSGAATPQQPWPAFSKSTAWMHMFRQWFP